jgi:ketosteroid isomerase-like protein
MAEPSAVAALVDEFLRRQREMYAGGDLEAVEELLAEDVVWHVPGSSPIAGDYQGRAEVTDYFRLRRELAGGAIRVTKAGVAHHEEALVQLADGRARLGGEDVVWRTAGVYRVAAGRIAEAWLVPLDQEQFDRAWARTRPEPSIHRRRVGSHGLPELFASAFSECWSEHSGERGRTPTLAAMSIRYLAPVGCDEELRLEVSLDRLTEHSIQVHYDAFVGDVRVAEGSYRYVPGPAPRSRAG